jgi:hypothetical protein
MSATHPLVSEFRYYLAHQDELVARYNGKVLAIENHTVIGAYDSEAEAVDETAKSHELGNFYRAALRAGTDAYTRVVHSPIFMPA